VSWRFRYWLIRKLAGRRAQMVTINPAGSFNWTHHLLAITPPHEEKSS
jgi:hypothetical protein